MTSPTEATEPQSYTLRVNGTDHAVADAWIGENLLHVLRERLGLPGSKNACEQGECGACSVLLDGVLVCSCLVAAATAVDAEITTIEAIGDGNALSTVQQAFVDAGAVQCGFCTPGLVMAVHVLIDRSASKTCPLTDLEIREAVAGNLCRCTGYGRVFAAIEAAIAASAPQGPRP